MAEKGNETVVIPLHFARKGTVLNYTYVPGLIDLDESKKCQSEDGEADKTGGYRSDSFIFLSIYL